MRFFLLILILSSGSSIAAIIDAASTSQTDVATAVSSSATGDTIRIPAGLSVWTGAVTVPSNKILSIQGACTYVWSAALTNADAVVATSPTETYIQKLNSGPAFILSSGSRVSQIHFELGNSASVAVRPNAGGFRNDHLLLTSSNIFCEAIQCQWLNQSPFYGLVDQNWFLPWSNASYTTGPRIVFLGDTQAAISTYMWQQDNYWGTSGSWSNKVYAEYNVFKGGLNSLDINSGGQGAFRYSLVIDSPLETHSNQGAAATNSRGGGGKSWEFYGNTLIQVNKSLNYPMHIRGGTGVVFSNLVAGTFTNPKTIFFDNVRSAEMRGIYGMALGFPGLATSFALQHYVDGTNAVANGTGTATAGAGFVLTDTTQNWAVNQFTPTNNATSPNIPVHHFVYNLTDGSVGGISNQTPTTITVTNLLGGTLNVWTVGDSYLVVNGYPARDQIGRGKDLGPWGTASPAPKQLLEPAYVWGNTYLGDGLPVTVTVIEAGNNDLHIVENRDYFASAKPSYTPLGANPLVAIWDGWPPPPPVGSVGISGSGRVLFGGRIRAQ